MSYVFGEETTICRVLLSIRVSEERETVRTCLFLIKKKRKKEKNIHDISQIFKESVPSHDGVTFSKPASNPLFFFYFSFISPFAPCAWPCGKKDVRSRFSAGLKPNWPMAGRQSFPVHYLCLIYLLLFTRQSEMWCCYLSIVRSSFSNFTSIHHLSRPRG